MLLSRTRELEAGLRRSEYLKEVAGRGPGPRRCGGAVIGDAPARQGYKLVMDLIAVSIPWPQSALNST